MGCRRSFVVTRSCHLLCAGLLLSLLAGCGAGYHATKGRELLAAGEHDRAIRRFEQALEAVKNDPNEAPRYRKELEAARIAAAHHHVKIGDAALAKRDLAGTASAYRKARTYAPADPRVVSQLSALLKLRMSIEADITKVEAEVARLSARPGDAATAAEWDAVLRTIRSLQHWQQDYPKAAALGTASRKPAAAALIASATQLAAMEKFDEAQIRVGQALSLTPDDGAARALQSRLLERSQADRAARKADKLLAAGDIEAALAAYDEALAADPASHAAATGKREARRQFVAGKLLEVNQSLLKKDDRGALVAVSRAQEVGTDSPAEAKELAQVFARLFKRTAAQNYKAGKKHFKKGRVGAAYLAWRIAAALGGQQKDLPARIKQSAAILQRANSYTLFMTPAKGAKGTRAETVRALAEGVAERLTAAGLQKVGLKLLSGKKAPRGVDGTLKLTVQRLAVSRGQRQVERSKKYLDRVEFPANPKWAQAQREQSAALASLNAATDVLRPQQKELNRLETALEKMQGEFVALEAKIAAEDQAWYADEKRKSPCSKGVTTCPTSYASRRWASHTAYHEKRINKTNAELKAMSQGYKAALAEVAQRQRAFDDAEVAARETPDKLRQEIWLDWPYKVIMHELAMEATVTVAWHDQTAKRKLADLTESLHDKRADFETPGVAVKKQALEQPRTSQLPGDEAVHMELRARILDALMPKLIERLRGHGLRFVIRAADARGDDGRVDALVRALSAGDALAGKLRVSLAKEVLERTGWDWQADKPVLERLPK